MNRFRIKYNEIKNLTLGSDQNQSNSINDNKKFDSKDISKDDNEKLNISYIVNTKSLSSTLDKQKNDYKVNYKPAIPSLKQALFNNQQKKAPLKLFSNQNENERTESKTIKSKTKSKTKEKYKNLLLFNKEIKQIPKAKSSTNSLEYKSISDNKSKIGFERKESIEEELKRKVVNLKSFIKKRNFKFDGIHIEGEGEDEINQYIKDLNKSKFDSDSSSKKKSYTNILYKSYLQHSNNS